MAWNARKNRNIIFKALYYQGKIIGFTYKEDIEINYVLPEYNKLIKKKACYYEIGYNIRQFGCR